MAATAFTGTPEEFKKKQAEQGMILVGKQAEDYYQHRDALGAGGGSEPSDLDSALQQGLEKLEARGRANLRQANLRSQVAEREAQRAEADKQRRADLAASWKGNPARSWDEAANRYNQLNITTRTSDWLAEAKQRSAAADARAREVRDRHTGWSASAIAALHIAQNNPDDKNAQAALQGGLQEIGNEFGKEHGVTFDGFTIADKPVNGEIVATMTWTREDGSKVSKEISASKLRGAYKGDAAAAVTDAYAKNLESYYQDRAKEQGRQPTPQELAKIERELAAAGLDKAKTAEVIAHIEHPEKYGNVGGSGGSGSSSSAGGGAVEAAPNYGGFKDAGAREAAIDKRATNLIAGGMSPKEAYQEATRMVDEAYPVVQQTGGAGAPGSGQNPASNAEEAARSLIGADEKTPTVTQGEGKKEPAPIPGATQVKNEEEEEADVGGGRDSANVEADADAKPEFSAKAVALKNETLPGYGKLSKGVLGVRLKELKSAREKMGGASFVDVGSHWVGDDSAIGHINNILFGTNDSQILLSREKLDEAISALEEVINDKPAGAKKTAPSTANPPSAAGGEEPAPAAEETGSGEGGEQTESEQGAGDAGVTEPNEAAPAESQSESEQETDWESRLYDLLVDGMPETADESMRKRHDNAVMEAMKHVSPEKRKQIREAANDTRLHNIEDNDRSRRAESKESVKRSTGEDLNKRTWVTEMSRRMQRDGGMTAGARQSVGGRVSGVAVDAASDAYDMFVGGDEGSRSAAKDAFMDREIAKFKDDGHDEETARRFANEKYEILKEHAESYDKNSTRQSEYRQKEILAANRVLSTMTGPNGVFHKGVGTESNYVVADFSSKKDADNFQAALMWEAAFNPDIAEFVSGFNDEYRDDDSAGSGHIYYKIPKEWYDKIVDHYQSIRKKK